MNENVFLNLHLGRWEQRQPLGINDRAESFDEGSRLLLDLMIHSVMRHMMDVLNFVLISYGGSASARDQLVRDQFAEHVLIERERQLQLPDIALVMFHQSQTAVEIAIQRGELVKPTVQRAARLPGKLRDKEWRKRHIYDNALKNDRSIIVKKK